MRGHNRRVTEPSENSKNAPPDIPQSADTIGPDDKPRSTSRIESRSTLPITLFVQAAASAALIAPAVAAPALMKSLAVGPVAIGTYVATVYMGAMLSSLYGVALVQRWGAIRTSQIALIVCASGITLVVVPNVYSALLGSFIVGLGYGPITPASSHMLARTTPPERIALVFSIKQTGVPLGGALAGLIVPFGLQYGGIPLALGQISVLCVLAAVLAESLRRLLDAMRVGGGSLPGIGQLMKPIRFVLTHHLLRQLAVVSFVFSIVQVCVTSYLVAYLTSDLAWGIVAAGAALSLTQGAGMVGRVTWGVLADRFNARAVLIGLALTMAAAGLGMSLLRPDTAHWIVSLLLVVYGATAVGWNGVYLGTVAKCVPHDQAASATGGTLFFTYFGVVIGPPLFGAIGGASGGLGIAYALLTLPLIWMMWTLARTRWDAS
ncbi:MFS transporter [soil metagenome]